MANNPIIKGDNTVLWGTRNFYSTGIIVSGSKKKTAEKLEIADNDGFTIAVIYFNQKNEFDFEMLVQTADPTLEIGDAITVATIVGALVENIEVVYEQKNVRRVKITAVKYTGLTLA